MIDPNWDVADLDPVTWRAIGEYIRPARYIRAGDAGEHALYLLHDEGRVLNLIDSRRGRRADIIIDQVEHPRETADALFRRGEWDRVHVIDKAHLQAVSAEAQADARHALTLDAYYRFVYQQFWDGEGGYVTSPPRAESWNGWTWSGVRNWIAALPSPSAIGLGVIGDDGLRIGVLAVASEGLVRRVTTFEALPVPRSDAAVTHDYFDQVWNAVADVIAPPAALLICTPDAFQDWLTGPDKQGAITRSVASGAAFMRTPSSSRG